jgi:hypothetical protein
MQAVIEAISYLAKILTNPPRFKGMRSYIKVIGFNKYF